MYRRSVGQLREWKDQKDRKPLVLAGARQVGKTYILKEFGKSDFQNVAYINCDDNNMAKDLFTQDYDMKQINLNDYRQRFALSGKPVVKVGINFDSDKGNIDDWTIEWLLVSMWV